MVDVVSCFYKRVYGIVLEYLIEIVQNLKKPIDDQSARMSDRHQKEEKKCMHGETLKECFGRAKARTVHGEHNKIGKNIEKTGIKYKVNTVFYNITPHPSLYVYCSSESNY
jgi:hypothetical protein